MQKNCYRATENRNTKLSHVNKFSKRAFKNNKKSYTWEKVSSSYKNRKS